MVDQYEEKISTNQEEFKKLYIFTFNYAKSTGQKSMEIEVQWYFMCYDKGDCIHIKFNLDCLCSLEPYARHSIPYNSLIYSFS